MGDNTELVKDVQIVRVTGVKALPKKGKNDDLLDLVRENLHDFELSVELLPVYESPSQEEVNEKR